MYLNIGLFILPSNIYKGYFLKYNMKKEDKRGQGLSITTIILVVLGVLVLVMLIAGFTMGWSKIMPFINPPNNVQSIADACASKCALGSQFDFCEQKREINFEDGPIDGIISGKEYTCAELTAAKTFGIDGCSNPKVDCDVVADDDADVVAGEEVAEEIPEP